VARIRGGATEHAALVEGLGGGGAAGQNAAGRQPGLRHHLARRHDPAALTDLDIAQHDGRRVHASVPQGGQRPRIHVDRARHR